MCYASVPGECGELTTRLYGTHRDRTQHIPFGTYCGSVVWVFYQTNVFLSSFLKGIIKNIFEYYFCRPRCFCAYLGAFLGLYFVCAPTFMSGMGVYLMANKIRTQVRQSKMRLRIKCMRNLPYENLSLLTVAFFSIPR